MSLRAVLCAATGIDAEAYKLGNVTSCKRIKGWRRSFREDADTKPGSYEILIGAQGDHGVVLTDENRKWSLCLYQVTYKLQGRLAQNSWKAWKPFTMVRSDRRLTHH